MIEEKKTEISFGDVRPEETLAIKVGCGTLYIIIEHDDKRRFKRLSIPRNTKFYCPLTTRDALAKLCTYQGRRNIKQLIKDLKGSKWDNKCDKYNITVEAASCWDAVAIALSRWLLKKRKKRKKKIKKGEAL